jgi:PAS domain S-box-containing protein
MHTDTSTILIVDDDSFGRKTLETLLNFPTYTLFFAHNGTEALECAATLLPDLILLDVMMPEIDGFEVCRRLRTDPHLAEVPIIMVTALGDRVSRLHGIEAGADDMVSKPFDPDELRTRVRSITRLNRYRRLLSERAKFERLTELAPDGIAILDTSGVIRLANPALLRMLNLDTASALVGTSMSHYIAPDQYSSWLEEFQPIVHDPTHIARLETTLLRSDGETIPVEVTAGHIIWEGQPSYQVSVRDITERKRAEAALLDSEERLRRSRDALRALFDGLGDGLLLLDNSGSILAINQAMSALLGGSPAVFVGNTWVQVCRRSTPHFPGHIALKALRDGRARHHRINHAGPDGQNRVFDMQTLPLPGPRYTIDQVIVHIVDVTERLQLEALAIQNEHFAARGRLAATVAHEVNTPLQSIQNCLYLAGKPGTSQRETYLNLARDELHRISAIVRQLLEPGGHKNDESMPTPLNLNLLVERVLLLTGGTLAKHGIDVERDLQPDLCSICGHPDHLTQVVLNLVLNAVDAMPDGGRLRLHTSTSTAAHMLPNHSDTHAADSPYELVPDAPLPLIVLEVSDTGHGIAADLQPRIFDPFFTTKTNGSGVGLSISRKIIEQHDGTIRLHSLPGEGSTFSIMLPASNAACNDD